MLNAGKYNSNLTMFRFWYNYTVKKKNKKYEEINLWNKCEFRRRPEQPIKSLVTQQLLGMDIMHF